MLRIALALLALVIVLASSPPPAVASDIVWLRQFGTPGEENASHMAADGSGNAYVSGNTFGAFPGQTNAGLHDAYLRKYDSSGTELWTRQFGTSAEDAATGVAVDGTGSVYLLGTTGGTLPGQTSAGNVDFFVRKYDSAGTELWTRQFGSSQDEGAGRAVAADGAGNVYVAGGTNGTLSGQTSAGGVDAVVRKYDAAGTEQWTRQFGTSGYDAAHALAVDGTGNAYAAGEATGTLPGQTSTGGTDAYVRKYNSSGTEQWTRQFGTAVFDAAYGVAADGAGNTYAAGWTNGTLPGQTSAGGQDAFVRRYDAAGSEAWTRQFGTSGYDATGALAVDGTGNAYVAGETTGTLPGQTSAGGTDAFVRKYHVAAGQIVWTRQFGSTEYDAAYGVAADGAGNAYAAGLAVGALPGQTWAGSLDPFVGKFGKLVVGGIAELAPGRSQPAAGRSGSSAWDYVGPLAAAAAAGAVVLAAAAWYARRRRLS